MKLPTGLGAVIALIVLVLVIVLTVLSMPISGLTLAVFLGLLAVARLT